MSYKDAIQNLRNLTLNEKQDFSVPAQYFLEHLVDDQIFYEQSNPLKEKFEFYKELLALSIVKHYGDQVKINSLRLMRLENYQFVHGGGNLSNGKMMVMYFFDEVYSGMVFASSQEGEADFFRLTLFIDSNK